MAKIVITYGTFDMFHVGHLNLFKRLKAMGEYLIVAVSTDEFNAKKGKKTLIPFHERVEIVRALRFVDEVIPEVSWDQKRTNILERKVDVFAIGDDWKGEFDSLSDICQVVYLERTPGISTTELKSLSKAL